MEVMEEHVDHSRVVSQLRRTGDWALQIGQDYMKAVQGSDLSAVNEALNEIFIEDEDYESLRKSIDRFKNFNMIALAQKLSTHELLEFRRISAYVYRCNKKWNQSIDLSKNDRMWKDCIDTANESTDAEIIEKLLRFFCETSEKECFCAALYTCFSHISPDVALELGWINGYHNFVMPFFIQTFKSTQMRLKELEEKTTPKEEEKAEDEIAATYGQLNGFNGGPLMLENGGMPAVGVVPLGMPQMGGPQMGAPQMNGMPDMGGFGGGPVQPQMPVQNAGMPQMALGM